jgi:hypothetical protein
MTLLSSRTSLLCLGPGAAAPLPSPLFVFARRRKEVATSLCGKKKIKIKPDEKTGRFSRPDVSLFRGSPHLIVI